MAIIRGDEGWLFLGAGNNDTLAYSTGQRVISEATVRGWHRLLELREAWLAQRGIPVYTFIAPNKEVVYADRLPRDVPAISDDRPARRIEQRVAGSQAVRLGYPLEALVAARATNETYPSHDSHWNGWGAFVFYREVMGVIAKDVPDVTAIDEDRFRFEEHVVQSDLGLQVDPPEKAASIAAVLTRPRARVVADNAVVNNGRVVRTEWSDRGDRPTLLVFHDSFHNWTRPMFAESFPITVSAHNYRLDFDLVEQVRPDVVLVEITERFLVRVPDDTDGMTTDELRLAKEAGELVANDAVPFR